MKRIFISILLLTVIVFSSCSTKTIIVSGTPGTTILTKNYEKKGVIEPSGQTKIKIKKRLYTHYLLSQAPNSEIYVPFALDYKNKRRTLYHLLIGPTAYIVGMCTLESSGIPILSGILLFGGMFEALGWTLTVTNNDYEIFNYKYLKNQTTNNDLISDSNKNTSE